MTTYPVEFHRRSERQWARRAQASRSSELGSSEFMPSPRSVRAYGSQPAGERPDFSMSLLFGARSLLPNRQKSAGPRTTRSCGSGAATPKGGELDAGGARNRGCAQAGWARGALGRPDQAFHCLCFALPDCCDPAAIGCSRSDLTDVGWRAPGGIWIHSQRTSRAASSMVGASPQRQV